MKSWSQSVGHKKTFWNTDDHHAHHVERYGQRVLSRLFIGQKNKVFQWFFILRLHFYKVAHFKVPWGQSQVQAMSLKFQSFCILNTSLPSTSEKNLMSEEIRKNTNEVWQVANNEDVYLNNLKNNIPSDSLFRLFHWSI